MQLFYNLAKLVIALKNILNKYKLLNLIYCYTVEIT
jgi:hypothetical protein